MISVLDQFIQPSRLLLLQAHFTTFWCNALESKPTNFWSLFRHTQTGKPSSIWLKAVRPTQSIACLAYEVCQSCGSYLVIDFRISKRFQPPMQSQSSSTTTTSTASFWRRTTSLLTHFSWWARFWWRFQPSKLSTRNASTSREQFFIDTCGTRQSLQRWYFTLFQFTSLHWMDR